MDACRDVNLDPKLIDQIDETERPMRDLPTKTEGLRPLGTSIILYSADIGHKALEWNPNPTNKLHYCEGTFEFLRHINQHANSHTLKDMLSTYKYYVYSELYPRILPPHIEQYPIFAPVKVMDKIQRDYVLAREWYKEHMKQV